LIERLSAAAIESVAIGFINSYLNPEHEQRVAGMLQAALPRLWISLSCEVSPQIREYDRLSTATANAYVQPLMASYLRDLERQLAGEGFQCPLLLVMSTGGLTTVDAAVKFPVRLVESGPAGGAILASEIARRGGFDKVVAFDMGGTTAKLCLIDDGAPQYADSFEVDRMQRFIRGSGLPLRIPTIEMVEIGAGGGSIASIDELGRLRMGPQSAGSDPGPGCYGRGGTHATVTDADLLLGRLDGRGFAGGLLDLCPDAAADVIARHVGTPLGVNVIPAAAAMSEIVDEAMANAARVHAVESGKDVSNRTLIAFGGAAPLHAARVADKLGISRVVIPADAGVGSAVGFLLAPVSFEVTRTWMIGLDRLTAQNVAAAVEAMYAPASATVRRAAPDDELVVELKAHMRYAAQGHELEARLMLEPIPDGEAFRVAFEERYVALYGRLIPRVPINLVALALRVSVPRSPVRPARYASLAPAKAAPGPLRELADSNGERMLPVPTYFRTDLSPGSFVEGPAIVAERQTTTVVPGGMRASIDVWGNIVMTRLAPT
jgi:N-methylhydantoinase A